MNKETREWLGLAGADGLVYIALGAAGASYFVSDFALDLLLLGTGLLFAIASCVVGMKPDSEMSAFTNFMKKISYPLAVFAVILVGVLNFALWSSS